MICLEFPVRCFTCGTVIGHFYEEYKDGLKEKKEDQDFCEIYLNQSVAPGGYLWIFPEGEEKVNVGLGVAQKDGFPNPKEQLYKHVLSAPVFKGSSVINGGSWFVPTRRPLDSMSGNGILIVGDAACQANPIHGGGMGPSMMGGMLAGETILEALEKLHKLAYKKREKVILFMD